MTDLLKEDLLKDILDIKDYKNPYLIIKRKINIYNLLNNTNYKLEDLNIKEIYNRAYNTNTTYFYYKTIDETFSINDLYLYKQKYIDISTYLKNILNKSKIKIDKYKYPYSIILFNDNCEFIVEQNFKYGIFYVEYRKIWSFIETNFKYKDFEISNLCNTILEEHFKSKEFTTTASIAATEGVLEEHFKSKEFTTIYGYTKHTCRLEEHFKSKEFTTVAV